MFNYIQKYFLIFLSLCVLPLYAMKRKNNSENVTIIQENPTLALLKTIEKIPYKKNEDWENIERCLHEGADANLKFGPYKTPLLSFLVEKQKKDLFDLALKKGANINACNIYGWTPLHLAAVHVRNLYQHNMFKSFDTFFSQLQQQSNLTIENLLIHGANVDAITDNHKTPLSWALENKNTDNAFTLMKYCSNSNVNHMDNEYTFVGHAIYNISYKLIRELFYKKASINIDCHGNTVFHLIATLISKQYRVAKPKKIINTVMTYANLNINEQIKTEALLLGLYGIKKANIILYNNLDIRCTILSKILSANYLPKKLYNCLLRNEICNHLPLELVHNHIERLKQLLQIQNNNDKTALELLQQQKNAQYATIIQPYLDGSNLDNDFNEFKAVFTQILKNPKENINLDEKLDSNNLALQIYKIHYAPEKNSPKNNLALQIYENYDS